jgi:hypothetical protein
MQRLTAPVADMISHVFMPITEQVVYKLLNDLGLKSIFDNRVYLNSESTGGSTSENEEHNVKLKENRIDVNMVPNLNPMTVKWPTATFNNILGGVNSLSRLENGVPVFLDVQTQMSLLEQLCPTGIELTVDMKFVDRVLANEAVNRVVTQYTAGEKIFVSDLAYNYAIPESVYTAMYAIYKMTPMQDDFLTYMSKFSGGRISVNVNRHDISGKREIVVKKNNAQVIAQIDYDSGKADASGTNQSADIYQVSFALTVQFARIHMLHLSYPVIVMNQPVMDSLITTNRNKSFRNPGEDHPYFSWIYYQKLLDSNMVVAPEVVNIPWYDDWNPPVNSPLRTFKYREFLTIALTLDNVGVPDGTTTIDITSDLPYQLIPEILESYAEYGSACLDYDSPFHIAVYANETQIDRSNIEFDGTVVTLHRQDILPVYRLVLAEYIGEPYGSINSLRVINYDLIAKKQ